MYLHLGADVLIKTSQIIGIFDLENTSVSKITREYLNRISKKSKVIYISNEMPRSFCVCESGGDVTVYVSPISPTTLKKRTGFVENIANI
ncbi:MAG: DUF370 domain-containing protein [Oscillospiraceae bacterium]|nr:DUF370 domain-containing protein [Oscillospiraceae bacterium]